MNRIYLIELFDCYESLLTDKERLYFSDYYEDDLSLAEIADNNKISRSAVQKVIKTVEEKLFDYEEKLKLLSIKNLINTSNDENLKRNVGEL